MPFLQRKVRIRRTRKSDIPAIIALSRHVYPNSAPWSEKQLSSHLDVFPRGQLVAEDPEAKEIVGMAASLIVFWDDYDMSGSWRDFTAGGMFTNHDPVLGKTLYGAEVMVMPTRQGTGIGKAIYAGRRRVAQRYGLLRIRAGARLRGYSAVSYKMSPDEYVRGVVRGELSDPTLGFQLSQGFHVLAVVPRYLHHDPESEGFAAVIEWLNPRVATLEDYKLAQAGAMR